LLLARNMTLFSCASLSTGFAHSTSMSAEQNNSPAGTGQQWYNQIFLFQTETGSFCLFQFMLQLELKCV
jgi:hypothetical protein